MVKKNNAELVKEYLEHIKQKKSVSAGTIKTYENIGNNLPFSLLLSQSLIEKKLKVKFKDTILNVITPIVDGKVSFTKSIGIK